LALLADGYFKDSHQYDRIAMLAIFMPIIQDKVYAYVEIWNSHTIRRQKERPHHVPSKPKVNYFFSMKNGNPNYGRLIDPELAARLQADTAEWGKCAMHIQYVRTSNSA